jgi:hypothetical protein
LLIDVIAEMLGLVFLNKLLEIAFGMGCETVVTNDLIILIAGEKLGEVTSMMMRIFSYVNYPFL